MMSIELVAHGRDNFCKYAWPKNILYFINRENNKIEYNRVLYYYVMRGFDFNLVGPKNQKSSNLAA